MRLDPSHSGRKHPTGSHHPDAAENLHPADVLVDGMRGPRWIWHRIRITLPHVPPDQRLPRQKPLADLRSSA